jgi:hydroxypyruvate isomerase
MPEIGVCIEPFFSHLDYEDRIRKVHDLGFRVYEFWFHNKRFDGTGLVDELKDFDRIAELNDEYGLTTADFVFNHPDGGIAASLINRKDRNRLLEGLEELIPYAKKIKCTRFISGSGNVVQGLSREEAVANMTEALLQVAKICEKDDITLLLEPFNTRVDHPDYFLDDPELGVSILKNVNHKNVKMLYDIYHMQIMTGNITAFVRENIDYIGHFHIAGVPGRHEPKDAELNYSFILQEIDKTGYRGFVGLEYWPLLGHEESLRQTRDLFKVS